MNSSKPQYVKCPLCGANDFKLRYPATIRASHRKGAKDVERYRCTSHNLAEHDDIVKCNLCGMVYNNPMPEPERLLDIYKAVEDPIYLEESKAREYTFKGSLEQLHRFIKPPGKLLDVGCYTGAFMEVAAAEDWVVSGTELSAWAAKIARDSHVGPVYEDSLDKLPVAPGSFNVITFWDVMEHLTQPKMFIRDASRLLKPGGILAFSTHMVDSKAARIMGTRYPFFMDMHVVHFSRDTVKRILKEQGYEVLEITTHYRILRIGYFLEKLAVKLPFARWFFKWLLKRKSVSGRFIKIGFVGLVNVFAKKIQ